MATEELSIEECQKQIIDLSKEKPNLRNYLATRLQQLAEEIRNLEVVPEATAEEAEGNSEFSPVARFTKGFQKFKKEKFLKQPELFEQLKNGQTPKFMVFACSDSRVCPTTILGFEPGEAFVVRNVANMIPPWDKSGYPESSAALEYGVLHLQVSHILVIGHSRCGGINALMLKGVDGKPWSDFIESWIRIGEPARAHTLATIVEEDATKQCYHCEKESVKVSLANLLTFPWVRDGVSQQRLTLHGAHYDFIEGSLEQWTIDLKVGSSIKS